MDYNLLFAPPSLDPERLQGRDSVSHLCTPRTYRGPGRGSLPSTRTRSIRGLGAHLLAA